MTTVRTKPRLPDLALIGSIILLAFAVHAPSVWTGYMSDDFDVLVVRDRPWSASFDAFPAGTGYYFRPLPLLTYRLEAALGVGPAGSHLVNLALHAATAVLVLLVARRLGAGRLLAAALAAWFAVHTANVTPVAWISARGDLMVGFFAMAAAYVVATPRRHHAVLETAALLAIVSLALLSKEAAGSLPIALALLLAGIRARGSDRSWWPLVVVGPPWLAWLAWTWTRVDQATGSVTDALPSPVLAFVNLAQAAYGTLVPLGRAWVESLWLAQPLVALGVAAAMGATVVLIYACAARQAPVASRWAALVVAIWLASLSPLLVLGSGLSFRQLYFPGALLAATVALVPLSRTGERRLATAVLVAVGVMTVASLDEGRTWIRNSELVRDGCTTWLERVPDAAQDPPTIVVSAPNRAGDVPVFSNDLPAVLHHCATGSFGRLRNVVQLVATELGRRDPIVGVSQVPSTVPDAVFAWSAPSRSAWARPWDQRVASTSAMVTEVHANGRAARIVVTVEAHVVEAVPVLDFGARGFHPVVTGPVAAPD
jgi:hypothetical protein